MLIILLPFTALAEEELRLDPIIVTATEDADESTGSSLGGITIDSTGLKSKRAAAGDSALLLQDTPGLSLYGAGGISSLPAIHGLADDRIRIRLDGADLTSACPNHMNSPLSYMAPTKVGNVKVFSGVTPVSVGGDSIGGTILVESAPPEFAEGNDKYLARGEAGTFYRSNGDAYGYNYGTTLAGKWLNLTYNESGSWSGNYEAAKGFKPVAPGREGGPPIPGDEVGSSAYDGAINRAIGLALSHRGHTLLLDLSRQKVAFEGFPNQRMDMTDNDNKLINLRYTGKFGWGDLEARFSYQDTRHEMDMGPDRFSSGTGMPMKTKAKTRGGSLQGNIFLSESDMLRIGAEYQYYTLYDWWPPVGGAMGPNDFWNIDYGRREKIDIFAEWEARWNERWMSQMGVRSDIVITDAGPVQGYDNGLAGAWGNDAAAFNAKDRKRTDSNWDLTALLRFTPGPVQSYEAGYARKTRSPNLYQRYPWSTNAMAALMNNFAGDGNGYIGDVGLDPEVANTVSLTGDWHDAEQKRWGIKVTGFYTYVHDYIDAKRCDFGQCSEANETAETGFVLLKYANQSAQLYGFDLSGHILLGKWERIGSFTGSGVVNYVRGENLSTGDNLYNIMPLNAKLAVLHNLGGWTTTSEIIVVAEKRHLSRVRNEVRTGGYWLMNLRSSYEWKHGRLDFAIENLFDRFYSNPLGGAYVGQGASMTTNAIPWGVPVPGMGRSFNVALSLYF